MLTKNGIIHGLAMLLYEAYDDAPSRETNVCQDFTIEIVAVMGWN